MTEFLKILTKAIRDRSCQRLVLSLPVAGESEPIEKLIVRPVVVRDEAQYQFAWRRDGKETHENLAPDATVERVCELFGTSFAHCHLFATDADYSARSTPGGEITLRKSRPTGQPADASHDRRKNYLIPDNVPCPFLHAIGVMTKAGQVRAAKHQKFRQINRFLELVDDVTGNLPADGPLNVVDFGCGKSYLTFALYHLLTTIHGRTVRITGLDRNADVIDDCKRIAERLGCDGLEFRIGGIADFDTQQKVHLAVSLHACDTATDDALAKAIHWQTDVILAVPCCQHELAAKVHNDALFALEQHGILKDRFAALVTDALRAKALEMFGYKTQVVEFIDLEHTRKNLLIRAVRREEGLQNPGERIESYRLLKDLLHLDQIYLEEALGRHFVERIAGTRAEE